MDLLMNKFGETDPVLGVMSGRLNKQQYMDQISPKALNLVMGITGGKPPAPVFGSEAQGALKIIGARMKTTMPTSMGDFDVARKSLIDSGISKKVVNVMNRENMAKAIEILLNNLKK